MLALRGICSVYAPIIDSSPSMRSMHMLGIRVSPPMSAYTEDVPTSAEVLVHPCRAATRRRPKDWKFPERLFGRF